MKYMHAEGVIKKDVNKLGLIGAALAYLVALTLGVTNLAKAAQPAFLLEPFEFVGTAENCGVAGVDTVTAEWSDDFGNPSPSIKLEKLGPTANCASAGVDIITPLEGQDVSNLTELDFDYKTDGHCGAGAPRFNVVVDGDTYFLGCTHGTHTDIGNGWTHVVFDTDDFATWGIPESGTLDEVYIIFDEGDDTPLGGTVVNAGTVYIDNISVNGEEVGSPTSPLTKDDCKKGGWEDFGFRNQGLCIQFVNTGKDSRVN